MGGPGGRCKSSYNFTSVGRLIGRRPVDWGKTPRARFGGMADAAYMYVWARADPKGLMSSI